MQDLLGTESDRVATTSETGADVGLGSGWNCRPTATPALGRTTRARCPTSPVSRWSVRHRTEDIGNALDAAGRIGDDWIQKNLGNGTVNQKAFTHGSSAQRQKWFTIGYRTGNPDQCNTFDTNDLG